MSARSKLIALLIAVASLAGAATSAAAQQPRVQGTVTDQEGRPLASAAVQAVDTEIGAFTDDQGRYVLQLPPGTYVLRAQTLGYAASSRTVTLSGSEAVTVNFRLVTKAIAIEELVVSLQAAQATRAQIGTDLERFDAEREVDKAAIDNLSDLLNGRTTGVSISESSGSVGAASVVRVRGSTSITQDNNPIIYVDGVRVSNATGTGPGSFDFGNGQTVSRLDDINPADIASVQVLKGPTAAAQYGSEAAAGVILITTKKGRAGQSQVNFSIEQGAAYDHADYWDNFFNLTTQGGFQDINDPVIQQFRPIQNPVTGDIFARHNPLKNPNTDPFRTAQLQTYTGSVRGGIEKLNYFVSARYENKDGVLQNNKLERFNFRANVDAVATEKLQVSASTNVILAETRLPDNDRSAVGMITNAGAGLPLFSFGTRPDGSRGDCLGTLVLGLPSSACEARQGNLSANFDKLATIQNTQEIGRFIASTTAGWTPASWLKGRLTSGLDFVQTQNRNLVPLDPDRPFGGNSDGVVNDDQEISQTITLDAAVTASFDLSPAVSSVTTAGGQFFSRETEIVGCDGRGFASAAANACNAALTFSGFSDRIENNEVGAFFQQRFGFNSYLFATGSVRVDDNSAFGDNLGAIISPSANLSAVLSKMPFLDVKWVNDLRFRFAWGRAAQAPVPFAAARTLRPVRVSVGGQSQSGVSLLDPGNPDLAPERNEEFEFGLDASLLNDRIGFKLSYYHQQTTDAIVGKNVAPSTGFSGVQFVNIGEVVNKGFEAQVGGTLVNQRKLGVDLDFKVFTQDAIVTDLGGQAPILFGLGADHLMFREGFSPGAYFGRVVANAKRDAAGNIVAGSVEFLPGNVGPNGGPDPNNPQDRFLGDQAPSNEESLSATITLFQNLRVFTLFDRAGGYVKFDQSNEFRSPFIPNVTGSREFALRQSEATPAEQASMELGQKALVPLFVSDATFIKWRELTVQYTLPQRLATLLGPIDALSITLGGRNLATITDYQGLDPELRFDGGRDSFNASEFFSQPPVRTFFVRLNATL